MSLPEFWQPALPRAQLWRTALGLFLVVVIWVAVSFGLIAGLAPLLGGLDRSPFGNDDSTTTAVNFLTFAGIHLGLIVALPLLHRRGYRTLFGSSGRLDATHFLWGAAVTLGVAAVLYALLALEHLVLPEDVPPQVVSNLALSSWLAWLLPALALIFMQVLAEEALFRGYLLQQLHARFTTPLAWAVLPAFAFGALHFDPGTYGLVNAAAYVLNATVLGVLAALITTRTGNLAAATGLHFGNNVVIVAVGIEGPLDGFSLFTLALDHSGGYTTYSILTQTAAMLLVYLLWRGWMNRKRPIANDAPRA